MLSSVLHCYVHLEVRLLLLNKAAPISGCMALNARVISELQIENHLKRNSSGPISSPFYEVCPKSKCTDFPMYELIK